LLKVLKVHNVKIHNAQFILNFSFYPAEQRNYGDDDEAQSIGAPPTASEAIKHLAAFKLYFNCRDTTDEKDFENICELETKLVSIVMEFKKQALITNF
jgi:hypothetical protein